MNLSLLLFFAARAKEILARIAKLEEKWIINLPSKLEDLIYRINKNQMDAVAITDELDNILNIHHEMVEFKNDYDCKCKGSLRKLMINFIFILGALLFLIILTLQSEILNIVVFGSLSGVLSIFSSYNIAYSIYKAVKEGYILIKFEKYVS